MTATASQRGFVWSAVAQVGIRAIALLRGLILARLLTPEDFGVFGMAQLFVGLVWVVADLGFAGYLTQLPAGDDFLRRRDGVLTLQLAWNGALALIAAMIAPLAPRIFPELQDATPLIAIVAVGSAAQTVMLTLLALLRRTYNWKADALIQLVAHAANVAAAVALAQSGAQAYALGWGWLALSATGATLGAIYLRGYWPTLDRTTLAEFRTYAVGYVGQAALWFVMFNIDNAVVALRLGKRELGFYGLAFNYGTMLPMAFGTLIAGVALPTFASLKGDAKRMARAYLLIARIGAPWIVPVLCVVAPLADRLIPLLFGQNWAEAGPAFQLLLAAGCARALLPSVQVFWAAGRTKIPFGIVAAVMAPTVPLLWWLAPRGIGVVAQTMLGFYVAVESIHAIASLRILRTGFRELFDAIRGPVYAGALVGGALLAARPHIVGAISTLGALGGGTLLFAGLLAAFDRGVLRDGRLIFARHRAIQERIDR